METIARPLAHEPGRFRYDPFLQSMISVFVVLSGENWNDLLANTSSQV